MDDELTTGGPTDTSVQAWPVALDLPPMEPLGGAELAELREGDLESDRAEALAVAASRGRGALDLAIGDGLAAMKVGDRLISLGFSSTVDYAREVLGIQERTAQSLAKLSRDLRTRPLLRAAVRSGEVRIRAAQTVLPVAIGDAEAEWVEMAKCQTVSCLEAMVREARSSPGDDDSWARLHARLTAEKRAVLDEALDLAGQVLGSASTRAQRMEAWAQEYLGEHPVDPEDHLAPTMRKMSRDGTSSYEEAKARLEADTQHWSLLPRIPGLPVPEIPFDQMTSGREIDRELRRLQAMRLTWDAAMGFGALAVKASGMHRILGFADFGHFCDERLGLGKRAVEQRVAVEKRLWEVPALRTAFRARKLSYEQVRILSHLPDTEIPGWIEKAQDLTCIELRRALEDKKEAQLRAAEAFVACLPMLVAVTVSDAIRSARGVLGRGTCDAECLVAIAQHFIDVWKPLLKRRKTMSRRVRERDGGHCQVPMCSRPAEHAHHIKFLSHGGPDTMENQLADCPCHHLRGIHGGYIRLTKTKDGKLVWVIAGRVWEGARKWREELERAGRDEVAAEGDGDDQGDDDGRDRLG